MAVGTTAAILIGAGLATAGSVAGALVNSKSVNDANKANADLAREQMSYQTSEREAVQAYKDPSNQRQLYEQAGFNPYMMLGNINAGDVQAQTGVGLPRVSPNTSVGDMLGDLGNIAGNSFNQYADLRIKDQQAEQLGIDNKIKSISLQNEATRQLLELQQRRADIANSKASISEKEKNLSLIDRRIRELDINLKYLNDFNSARTDEMKNRADYTKAQEQGQLIQNDIQEKVRSFLPSLQSAQLKNLAASTFSQYQSAILSQKQGHLTDEQRKTEVKRALGQSIQNELKRGDIKIQQLDINQHELDALRRGEILKRSSNSDFFRNVDGFANWLISLPMQFFK